MFKIKIGGMLAKHLFKKPVTRRYPFEKREPFARTRGSIQVDIDKCTLCTLCDKKCPTQAIDVNRELKYWSIDRMRCIACNACVEVCPVQCLTMLPSYAEPAVGAAGKASSITVVPHA